MDYNKGNAPLSFLVLLQLLVIEQDLANVAVVVVVCHCASICRGAIDLRQIGNGNSYLVSILMTTSCIHCVDYRAEICTIREGRGNDE